MVVPHSFVGKDDISGSFQTSILIICPIRSGTFRRRWYVRRPQRYNSDRLTTSRSYRTHLWRIRLTRQGISKCRGGHHALTGEYRTLSAEKMSVIFPVWCLWGAVPNAGRHLSLGLNVYRVAHSWTLKTWSSLRLQLQGWDKSRSIDIEPTRKTLWDDCYENDYKEPMRTGKGAVKTQSDAKSPIFAQRYIRREKQELSFYNG